LEALNPTGHLFIQILEDEQPGQNVVVCVQVEVFSVEKNL
jgi:hypothetical protein